MRDNVLTRKKNNVKIDILVFWVIKLYIRLIKFSKNCIFIAKSNFKEWLYKKWKNWKLINNQEIEKTMTIAKNNKKI